MGWVRGHRGAALGIVVVGAIVFAAGIYWFAPQNLFLDERVDQALPTAGSDPAPADPTGGGAPAEPDPDTVILAQGEFASLEHETTGVAQVIELADGSRYLRLEDLQTSNGPDLRVYLTDQPLSDDWRVWDDGDFVDLGGLAGNVGSSNYEIPDGVDPSDYRTAVIWCRRFTVGFAVAPIMGS